MKKLQGLKSALVGGASVLALVHPAAAKIFNIPEGDLAAALVAYMKQSDVAIIYADDVVHGHRSHGAKGDYTEIAALTQILRGTGLSAQTMPLNAIGIVVQRPAPVERLAQAARRAPVAPMPAAPAAVETVVVTAQHKSENIQQVPIAVTALSQQQLTDRQIAGGPDLLRSVPNMDFTKTNFSGYNIELRGIGTQAISVTTDPAVAVAFNGTPFIRNHFFEQEFFDLDDVEVLLGPQGTLYGRNATAGVINLKSALPTDSYEAMMSADIGNYESRRLEGMVNIPIVGDKLDIRLAAEWTKREGYTEDTTLNTSVDGRDLWSGRMTIGWKPASNLQTYFIWEHFDEDDDRLRSGKQLCETAPIPTSITGQGPNGYSVTSSVPLPTTYVFSQGGYLNPANYLSQGCQATSLYAPSAFEVPNGYTLPYVTAAKLTNLINVDIDPYAETTQSTNLRQIQSTILPTYRAKNDTLEYNTTYNINPALTLTSQTGYNNDFLWSTEDYNRFDSSPGIFVYQSPTAFASSNSEGQILPNGEFCDPQLGCSNRIVAEDLDEEHAWQASQEFRLASNFSGPFNFSFGANYLHYETEENYYVFINALTLYTLTSTGVIGQNPPYVPGVTTNADCLYVDGYGYQPHNPKSTSEPEFDQCNYIDPNPIGSLNNEGHNYFLSQNPYTLNSYAVFGETYYNITSNLKLTEGVRWTVDQKHFTDIPSEVITNGWGYGSTGVVNQSWSQPTGRAVLDWTPDLSFTDQTLVYASVAHGYKAGGANPPGAALLSGENGLTGVEVQFPDHPLIFKPEYIEAFEFGAKNTLLDGSLTLNGDIFYYNYTGYQISEIVDRSAINNNYNAHVEGAEVTANWEPLPGLKFNFAGGWEDTAAAGGDSGIDLMDRTAGMPGWMVVKPVPTQPSNCILPTYVVAAILQNPNAGDAGNTLSSACGAAYNLGYDPVTQLPYVANPSIIRPNCCGFPLYLPANYPGFNPNNPLYNDGEGFSKNLTGHALPNAPPFTVSLGGEYSMPVSEDWVATLRGDFYWQADSWARVFNDDPYDRLEGYTNVNLALVLTSANGWQVMGYVKNVFNVTAITGDFLNSDDSGLTTNVFLTDPRLYGIRVTKHLDQDDGFWGKEWSGFDWFSDLFADTDNGKPPLWIELGGQLEQQSGQGQVYAPPFLTGYAASPAYKPSPLQLEKPPLFGAGEEAKVSFLPDGSDWVISAAVRYGRANGNKSVTHETAGQPIHDNFWYYSGGFKCCHTNNGNAAPDYADTTVAHHDSHMILDFQVGKDVGLGWFGRNDESMVSAGVRYAAFMANSSASLFARPDVRVADPCSTPGIQSFVPGEACPTGVAKEFAGTAESKRSFRGVGPEISWNSSVPVLGDPQAGEFAFDWGANAALLFGRQKAKGQHHESCYYQGHKYGHGICYTHPVAQFDRSKNVVAPNLGGFAGVSFRYSNAKVSLGYRSDFFFNAMDTGWDARKTSNVGFSGPFATISFGIGG
jgi:iron complex outermembrane receptor protein